MSNDEQIQVIEKKIAIKTLCKPTENVDVALNINQQNPIDSTPPPWLQNIAAH